MVIDELRGQNCRSFCLCSLVVYTVQILFLFVFHGALIFEAVKATCHWFGADPGSVCYTKAWEKARKNTEKGKEKCKDKKALGGRSMRTMASSIHRLCQTPCDKHTVILPKTMGGRQHVTCVGDDRHSLSCTKSLSGSNTSRMPSTFPKSLVCLADYVSSVKNNDMLLISLCFPHDGCKCAYQDIVKVCSQILPSFYLVLISWICAWLPNLVINEKARSLLTWHHVMNTIPCSSYLSAWLQS